MDKPNAGYPIINFQTINATHVMQAAANASAAWQPQPPAVTTLPVTAMTFQPLQSHLQHQSQRLFIYSL